MSSDSTMETDVPAEAPVEKAGAGSRALSAVIAATIGALVGFFIGTWGDSRHRKVAQSSFAAMGAVFGGLLSYFATKRQDVRSYDMTGAPAVLLPQEAQRPAPKPPEGAQTTIDASTVELDGTVEPEMARAASR